MYKGVIIGFALGIVLTISFVLYYQKAMPALLFILPLEMACIILAAYWKHGLEGVTFLLKFDEEKALKVGGHSAMV